MDPATGFLAGAGITAGANLVGTAVNALQAEKWNRKQYNQTEKWNQINLDYAKNAQTYAAADRMRAGLSPLDVQPQSAPSSNIASPQQADFSGIGAAGNAIQSGIQAAMRYKLDENAVYAQVELNNALKSKAESEALQSKAETLSMIGKYKTELELQKAELERVKNVNSTYKKEVEARLAETYQRIADLESQVNQRDTLTPSLVALNNSSAGRNNAESATLQSDLTFANAFNIPYSMVKNLNFNTPYSTAVYGSYLASNAAKTLVDAATAGKDTSNLSEMRMAYDDYSASYDTALQQINDDWKAAKARHDTSIFDDLKARTKALGKKLSFNQFVKKAKRK